MANKTGTGDYGRANDIAVVWPPRTAPLVMAIMSDRSGYTTAPTKALLAEEAARRSSPFSPDASRTRATPGGSRGGSPRKKTRRSVPGGEAVGD